MTESEIRNPTFGMVQGHIESGIQGQIDKAYNRIHYNKSVRKYHSTVVRERIAFRQKIQDLKIQDSRLACQKITALFKTKNNELNHPSQPWPLEVAFPSDVPAVRQQTEFTIHYSAFNIGGGSPTSGDHSMVEPPGPIPNPEVKRCCADGSGAIGPVRVGRCQVFARLHRN